jgi:hypothetical protein
MVKQAITGDMGLFVNALKLKLLAVIGLKEMLPQDGSWMLNPTEKSSRALEKKSRY